MEDEIRWKVTDPLGNEIVLRNITFIRHIVGDHADKDAAIRMSIENQVKYTLSNPRFIIKDRQHADRWKYMDLALVPLSDTKKLKSVGIIVEVETKPFKIVTWYARRVVDEPVGDGGMIYDASEQTTPSL